MSRVLRVLLVEDSEDDAQLIVYALQAGGYEVSYARVATAETLRRALCEAGWDIILSDYSLPEFDGLSALSLAKQLAPGLPFIIVSGTIGEDVAVEAMKSGAQDYILKDNLYRLLPAVEREVHEGRERLARYRVEENLRRSEERLLQSQRLEAVGRLAGGVAHDFNNHLTVILGLSDLLMGELGDSHDLHQWVRTIKETALRSADLTRQLLAFSRKQILEPRVLDLNRVVTDITGMLRRLIGTNIDLSVLLDPALGKVKADPGQIEQVVTNLVVNARDAMPDGGRLTIETANADLDQSYADRHTSVRPGPYSLLVISDTGTGMDRETQGHIFEPFFTTKEKEAGTGLGLATVYGIVKQSGGYIWVYSEPGHGTAFKIYLPRLESAVESPVIEKPGAATLSGSETVLLAEDEAMLRKLTREYLSRAGYSVLEAGNGAEALEICEQHSGVIDLLMTDVMMPGIATHEFVKRLQQRRPNLKVLYMSGYTNDTVFRNHMVEREAGFLQKPFTREGVLLKVRQILDSQV